MACSNSTLVVGRPSQSQYQQYASTTAVAGRGCGTPACNGLFASHDRTLGPRKHREKVRENIKDAVLLKLGAPVTKIELDSQQLDYIVDYVLKLIEDYAPREYFDYESFYTVPGKSVYKLRPEVGIVRDVYYNEQGANFAFNQQDLGGAMPLDYFYPGTGSSSLGGGGMMNPVQPAWGNMGEWVLFKQYENMYARTSSHTGGWEWVSDMGYIKLYPVPYRQSQVFVHYLQKCKDWKEMTAVMVDGAYAEALIILGNIRGKFQVTPGPNGGIQLDGDRLREKGYELKEKWMEDLIYRWGDLGSITTF